MYARGMQVLALHVIALLAGCDSAPEMDYSLANLVKAGGTVTLDGKPLPNAVVTFEAPDGTFAYAMTDEAGDYELQFDSAMQGVTPGPKTVRISTTRRILGLNSDDEHGGEIMEEGDNSPAAATGQELVPPQYNRNSQLTVEVTPDKTDYDFDLKS